MLNELKPVEPPTTPARKSSGSRILAIVIIATVTGLILAVAGPVVGMLGAFGY